MRIAISGDVHWSQYSSIIRQRGNKYSLRLENLIQSVNWFYRLAEDENCDMTIMLGDFFDKAELNSEEISALNEIQWSCLPNFFIAGNHEMGLSNNSFSSANVFNLLKNGKVITSPTNIYSDEKLDLFVLPYILEENRKESINDYFNFDRSRKSIIFSHNDLKDLQMGTFKSTDGFSISDIDNNCDLYINGHIHNCGKITNKIINIGNLTGQNFSEDAFMYDHTAIILDTESMNKSVYLNPYAFNFYKLDFTLDNSIDNINHLSSKMGKNCVVTVKCFESDYEYLKHRFDPKFKDAKIPYNCNVIESRFIVQQNVKHNSEDYNNTINISVDHLQKFKDYMVELIGDSDILQKELIEVCK